MTAPIRVDIRVVGNSSTYEAWIAGEPLVIQQQRGQRRHFTAPLSAAARYLHAKDFPPEQVLEMWRPGKDSWDLRGTIGALLHMKLEEEEEAAI